MRSQTAPSLSTELEDEWEIQIRQTIAKLGIRLLKDPLSKTTRRRQEHLLLASVLALGLALSAVDVSKLKDSWLAALAPAWAVIAVCSAVVFLLALFVVGAQQDALCAGLARRLCAEEMAKIYNRVAIESDRVKQDRDQTASKADSVQMRIKAAVEQRDALLKQYGSEVSHRKDFHAIQGRITTLSDIGSSLADEMLSDDRGVRIQDLVRQSELDLQRAQKSQLKRVLIEVWFPILFAAVTIAVCIWRLGIIATLVHLLQ